ncbi:MAG TPA: hypothetical protein PL045_00715 [Chitinophagaceae bacterium]|nr:hypothetical protein [Chitinophagaceae bacterium]
MIQPAAKVFDYSRIIKLHKLLPSRAAAGSPLFICRHCRYINPEAHQFCTNCGYPHDENKMMPVYNIRMKNKKELLRKSEERIIAARITLYVMSALFFTGTAIVFSKLINRYMVAFTSLLFSVMFFLLAKWTLHKPFTALLAAFIILLTCCIIGVIGQFGNAFTIIQGMYGLTVSLLLIFLLLRGIQGAHKSGLLKDEMEIL